MKEIYRQFFVFSISLLFLGASAQARPGKHRSGGFKKIFEQLDLTPEQVEKLKELKPEKGKGAGKERRTKMKAFREKKMNLRNKMLDLFVAGASESEMRKVHQEIKTLRGQMQGFRGEKADIRFEKILKIKDVLNKEQREKFSLLQKEKLKKRRQHRKNKFDDEDEI